MPPHLRPAARAIILDETDRVLLCRFDFTARDGLLVWAAPGGGVEADESLLEALRRELVEEVGLTLVGEPPHVWHQEVVGPGLARSHDGLMNDFFLVRTTAFEPSGALSEAEMIAENVSGMRWWTMAELAGYAGTDVFSPRDFPARLAELLASGPPQVPHRIGE